MTYQWVALEGALRIDEFGAAFCAALAQETGAETDYVPLPDSSTVRVLLAASRALECASDAALPRLFNCVG